MSDLSSIEKMKFEKLLGMNSGYVLDFSNRSFKEFFLENAKIDIFQQKYNYASGSKSNRLRAFWTSESNITVGNFMMKLVEYWKIHKELNQQIITLEERNLFDECKLICTRLINNSRLKTELTSETNTEKIKQDQLRLLLHQFDDLSISMDRQRRGYLLQSLLNQLFTINGISVIKSFQRNDGGEQIDGAFFFDSWHYLVECKWTEKVADIKELDSLLGKVNRSGKQTMGLFLSIEGWSENVPILLKQNPAKCILLMEGYDLRCVLDEAIDLEVLLRKKIAKLNFDADPFLSVVKILNS